MQQGKEINQVHVYIFNAKTDSFVGTIMRNRMLYKEAVFSQVENVTLKRLTLGPTAVGRLAVLPSGVKSPSDTSAGF